MGKEYDRYVTPQNTRRFRERRILFLAALSFFSVDFLLFAMCSPGKEKGMATMALLIAGFAAIHWFERRKELWTWPYLITILIIGLTQTAFVICKLEQMWYFAVLIAEVLVWGLAALALLRSPRKR